MKHISIALIGLLFFSCITCLQIKKTETSSCSLDFVWYDATTNTFQSVSTSTPVVYTYPTYPVTYPVYSYPISLYSWVYFRKGQKEVSKMSVVHDNDLKKFEVKGNLFHRDETHKENWYAHGGVDEKMKSGLHSCLKVHSENRKNKFKNIDQSKISKNIPEFLVPKMSEFNRSPKIENKEAIKEVKKTEESKEVKIAEENKVVKKVEESKRPPPATPQYPWPHTPPHKRVEEKKDNTSHPAPPHPAPHHSVNQPKK